MEERRLIKENRRKTDQQNTWQEKWRTFIAFQYIIVCLFDFIINPIFWSFIQAHDHGVITNQWIPLTLSGAGLYHLSMGAILGVSAY